MIYLQNFSNSQYFFSKISLFYRHDLLVFVINEFLNLSFLALPVGAISIINPSVRSYIR